MLRCWLNMGCLPHLWRRRFIWLGRTKSPCGTRLRSFTRNSEGHGQGADGGVRRHGFGRCLGQRRCSHSSPPAAGGEAFAIQEVGTPRSLGLRRIDGMWWGNWAGIDSMWWGYWPEVCWAERCCLPRGSREGERPEAADPSVPGGFLSTGEFRLVPLHSGFDWLVLRSK